MSNVQASSGTPNVQASSTTTPTSNPLLSEISNFPGISQPSLPTNSSSSEASQSNSEVNGNNCTGTSPRLSQTGNDRSRFVDKEAESSKGSSLTRKLSDKVKQYKRKIFPDKNKDSRSGPDTSTAPGRAEDTSGVTVSVGDVDLDKHSPFGPYTLEGVMCLLLATVFSLYLEMPGEIFVCYIMACCCVFYLLRITKFIR